MHLTLKLLSISIFTPPLLKPQKEFPTIHQKREANVHYQIQEQHHLKTLPLIRRPMFKNYNNSDLKSIKLSIYLFNKPNLG